MPRLFLILLIIVLLYYLFRLAVRYIFPFLVKYFIGKSQRDDNTRENRYEQRHRRKEGEVNIDYKPEEDKKKSGSGRKNKDDSGEYVDYEEL